MALEPEGLRDAEARGEGGEPDPDGGRDGGPVADLEREAGYGAAGSPSDLGGDALGGGAGLPGRQPGGRGHRRGAATGTASRPRHHPALPYAKVGGAIETVRMSGAYRATVLAFEFLVLTACGSGEVRGALWKEMDLEGREWRIPPERMKTGP